LFEATETQATTFQIAKPQYKSTKFHPFGGKVSGFLSKITTDLTKSLRKSTVEVNPSYQFESPADDRSDMSLQYFTAVNSEEANELWT
jgi:hypothetical protein